MGLEGASWTNWSILPVAPGLTSHPGGARRAQQDAGVPHLGRSPVPHKAALGALAARARSGQARVRSSVACGAEAMPSQRPRVAGLRRSQAGTAASPGSVVSRAPRAVWPSPGLSPRPCVTVEAAGLCWPLVPGAGARAACKPGTKRAGGGRPDFLEARGAERTSG